MTRVRLDFDAPGARIGATSWFVLALGVLAAAWVAQSWLAARLAERQAQAVYAAASDADQRARRQATTARRAEPPARQQRARNDAALARALALSWEDLLLPLQQAVVACLLWGMLVLTVLSVVIARGQKLSPWSVISEHLAIATLVTALSWLVGIGVNLLLG